MPRSLHAFAAALLLGVPALASGPVAEVEPGGVVRWPAAGAERCAMGGKRWQPIDGVCWYPIDLLTPPGELRLARLGNGRWEERSVRVGAYPYDEQRLAVDDSQVHLSPEDLARVRREQRRVGALWGRDGPRAFSLPLAAPLDPLPAGGRFGARRVFNDEPRSPHTGGDYGAKEGTPVAAAAAGTVVLADDLFFSGKSVFIDHGDGLISMYFHLSEMAVAEGERVDRTQTIGRVGATGRATGPHLHFGIRWRGARVDPAAVLAEAARTADIE